MRCADIYKFDPAWEDPHSIMGSYLINGGVAAVLWCLHLESTSLPKAIYDVSVIAHCSCAFDEHHVLFRFR